MISTELIDSIQNNNVVVFVGEEFSISAGLPSWADFIYPLAKVMDAPWPADQNDLTIEHLLRTTSFYENQFGRHALIDYLRKALKSRGKQPSSLHHLLASFSVKTIFTTNYDDFIEKAFQQINREYNLIIEESELVFWDDNNVQMVKLCGDLTRPDSIVITQNDFNTYFSTHPRLAERLHTILETKTALFLGYSSQVPFFSQIWGNIGLNFGKLRRRGYIVLFDASPLIIDQFRHQDMQVINL